MTVYGETLGERLADTAGYVSRDIVRSFDQPPLQDVGGWLLCLARWHQTARS